MVDTVSTQYGMPVKNEAGYVIILPNVASSEKMVQNPHPDPYAAGDEKLFPIGTKLICGERAWRYCYNGDSILAIAAPIQSPADTHADLADNCKGLTATAIGSNIVYLTSSTNKATSPADERDEYAEGYLYFNDAEGQGQCRKIKNQEPFSGTSEIKFTLYEDLTIASVGSSSEAGIIRNPYWMVVTVQATMTGMAVGVPGIPVPVNDYFWSQTAGPCAVLTNAAIAVGTGVVVGTTEGNVDPESSATTETIIGWPMSPGITETEEMLVFLTLD